MASLLKFRWEGVWNVKLINGPADEELKIGLERTTEKSLMMMPFGCGTHNQNHPLLCKTPPIKLSSPLYSHILNMEKSCHHSKVVPRFQVIINFFGGNKDNKGLVECTFVSQAAQTVRSFGHPRVPQLYLRVCEEGMIVPSGILAYKSTQIQRVQIKQVYSIQYIY